MTIDDFETLRKRDGYGPSRRVSFAPLSRSAPHVHDEVSFVYVVEGEFILNTGKDAKRYFPGETCVLGKDIEHAEEAGPNGSVILLARRPQTTP